ncbi:MAG TPA: zinc-dependent alcohol dehydrogenase family protein [Spirochaetia bacterium]|nr:zinc-dependent alcohol dehydrogenase family protein [Spirochaetia bacterium]
MKAAIVQTPGTVVVKDVPVPTVGPGDVLIEVKASGICGTDIHIFRGEYLGSYPVTPGHEFSGIVSKVGAAVTRFKPGDHVAVEPNIACDNCPACLSNRQNFCVNWNGVGVTLPGGMAQYAMAPERAVFNIGTLPFASGAFVEPLSCVLHGVQRTGFTLADRVLVIGAGPIGILLLTSILLEGASSVVSVDKNAARRKLAESSGAGETAASLEGLPADSFDVVVDATGVPALMEKTLSLVRPGGRVLLFGVPPSASRISLEAFMIFRKGLTILSSYTSVRNSLQAVRLLETGRIDVSPLVSHQLPLADFARGISLIEEGKEGVLKVLIRPDL